MNDQQSPRVQLRQKPSDLCLTVGEMTIAVEQIDLAFDDRVEAGLQPRFDPLRKAGGIKTPQCSTADCWIEFNSDHAAKPVFLYTFGQLHCSVTEKCAGFDDQLWLDRGHYSLEKIENL